jgi:hypothetical protein
MCQGRVVHPVLAGGGEQHSSVDFTPHKVEGTSLQMMNVWGFDYDNFMDETMQYMLRGKMPRNFTMRRQLSAMDRDRLEIGSAGSRHHRRVHSVLVFVGPKDLERGEVETSKLKMFLQQIQAEGYNPILVVSQVDMLATRDRQNWRNPAAPYWVQLRKNASLRYGVPLNSVYLNVNYVDELETDYDHDAQTYEILRDAMSRAVEYERLYGGPDAEANQAESFVF